MKKYLLVILIGVLSVILTGCDSDNKIEDCPKADLRWDSFNGYDLKFTLVYKDEKDNKIIGWHVNKDKFGGHVWSSYIMGPISYGDVRTVDYYDGNNYPLIEVAVDYENLSCVYEFD